ncbi:MAG TPA: hypothetical protein VHD60_01885, partial [Candidatus Saccharimonadales bacterium]|nr:hypothetical protein [Candidatus Saccharimonadales bacterium]
GRLAWPDSTHCTGNTFDVDATNYFKLVEPHRLRPVIDPRRDVEVWDSLDGHDARVVEAAVCTARLLQNEGLINCVPEFVNSPNQCLHISVHPDLTADDILLSA